MTEHDVDLEGAPCALCGDPRGHRRSCPEWAAREERLRTGVLRADEIREARATGKRVFPSAVWALRWYLNTRSAWASPKALPIDPDRDGTGAPNRGADDPKRVAFAKVAWAIHLAELDDRSRHAETPAPLMRWLAEHFGAGRAYAWIAESDGWQESEVEARVERALRVVRKRLRDRDLLEGA